MSLTFLVLFQMEHNLVLSQNRKRDSDATRANPCEAFLALCSTEIDASSIVAECKRKATFPTVLVIRFMLELCQMNRCVAVRRGLGDEHVMHRLYILLVYGSTLFDIKGT